MSNARHRAWRALVALHKGRSQRLNLDTRGLKGPELALAIELARGTERRHITLDFAIAQWADKGLPKDPELLSALRLGAYQILELDRIPVYAAVDQTLRLLGRGRGFANAVLRRLADAVEARAADPARPRIELPLTDSRTLVLPRAKLPDPETKRAAYLAIVHSLPRFLVARWLKNYGAERTAAAARASSRTPAVILRASGAGGDAAELRELLQAEGVATEALEHRALLRWSGGASPFAGAAFTEGRFVVQDPTALAAAEAVDAQAGETVLDLCAAPGTKATLLAEAVGVDGRVYAFDADERRRAPIRENAARLGLTQLVVIDAVEDAPRVDRVLIDVPCSNTGVLARRVEVRRRLRPEVFAALADTQKDLLNLGLGRLRTGGAAVYSTCSIEPEENQEVIATIDAHLVSEQVTLPADSCDGGFFAVLQRNW